MTHPLTIRTLADPYTLASFKTLTRHAASPQGLHEPSALRLLRRNVRDVQPSAPHILQQHVAQQLLQHWRNSANA